MSARTRELAERRAQIQLRCASQRQMLADEVRGIEDRLQSVDRAVVTVRRVITEPLVILSVVLGLLVIGPSRVMHTVSRTVLIGAALKRLWRLVRR